MKKLYAVVAVLALSLTIGVTALAQAKASGKGSKKAACSSCNKSEATPEQIRKFKLDTIDLRQEMMNKRFDLQRENLKDAPDAAKVSAIKADIEALKVKLDAAKTAAKLPAGAACGNMDCPLMDGNCDSCMKGNKSCATAAKSTKACNNCNKKGDCGCTNCSKGACDKCDKAANCNCSKKSK
ncbi:MAG: hypothetical protein FIA91_04130 [Geobacter sp.]|nr:hypothetical protein [Geobacter sp.]